MLDRLLPGLRVSDDWESLLDHRLADAVLVGRGTANDALRAEQLKRLVADIMPVLAVHPSARRCWRTTSSTWRGTKCMACCGTIRRSLGSPAVAELADWVQTGNGPIGVVHQIICNGPWPTAAANR